MKTISAKQLRADLAGVLERARNGEKFTVIYRSRPVCQIGPLGSDVREPGSLEDDPLYRAGPVGRSRDGRNASDHDEILYPVR
jgi:antitoxin (DNA-binding transcriptional repressor) of toxin-antitoxin stability system